MSHAIFAARAGWPLPSTLRTHAGLFILLLTHADAAQAEIAILMAGRVQIDDRREQRLRDDPEDDTDDTAAYHRGLIGTDVGLPNCLLRLTPIGPSGAPIETPTYTHTTADGGYVAVVTVPTREDTGPQLVEVEVAVMYGQAEGFDVAGFESRVLSSPPDYRFRAVGGPVDPTLPEQLPTILISTYTTTLASRSLNGRNFRLPTTSIGMAYLSTEEFFTRVVDARNGGPAGANVLSAKFTGVKVFTNGPLTFAAPNNLTMNVAAGLETSNPASHVAHELGHLVAWTLFESNIPLLGTQDYCFGDGPGSLSASTCTHNLPTLEHERAAWHEGWAQFLTAAWYWPRDRPTPMLEHWDGALIENAVIATGSTNLDCETDPLAHRREFCQAAALWDVFDAPRDDTTGEFADDDALALSLPEIFEVLDGYADDCSTNPFDPMDNHCSNEQGLDAMNHWDFIYNFGLIRSFQEWFDLGDIFDGAGLSGGATD